MQRDELKALTLNMLTKLSKQNENFTLEEAIEYLKNSNDIFNIDDKIEKLKDDYKEVAVESINSYKKANQSFEKIAQKQQEHLENINQNSNHIDLGFIQAKFSDIQDHLLQEVQRANSEISRLTEKVKLLEEESNIDPLTKTFNRRALNRHLELICKKGSLKQELHLVIMDLDDFKNINDKYGHIAGDKILIFIANILKKLLRDGDKVFRYGGEEFVIILNRLTSEQCSKIANRILKQISDSNLIYKNDTIGVTVSMGGTKYKDSDTPDTLLNRADEALYEAKNSGKNKFVAKLD